MPYLDHVTQELFLELSPGTTHDAARNLAVDELVVALFFFFEDFKNQYLLVT